MAVVSAILAVVLAGPALGAKVSPKPGAAGAGALELKWEPGLAEAGPTASFKYQVRAVPDGAGGVVLAWEENRFRKACCHDLRDVYAQRFDAAGKPLWSVNDIVVAGEDAGEELVGLLPRAGGGALVLWRRDTTMFFAGELTGSGTPLTEPRGRILSPCKGSCEWDPLSSFAVGTGGVSLAAWVERGKASQLKVLRIVRARDSFTYTSAEAVMGAEELRAAAAVPCGKEWLALAWMSNPEGGSCISGMWLDGDAAPHGTVFMAASDGNHRWINMESVPAGDKGAFVLWSAVNPDSMGKTHQLFLTQVRRLPDGSSEAKTSPVAQAKTSALYIPPPEMELDTTFTWTGRTHWMKSGPENLFWRRTSSLRAVGARDCLVWWISGDTIKLAGAEAGSKGPSIGKPVTIGASVDTGFSPFVAGLGGGRSLMVWSEKRNKTYRVLGRVFTAGQDGPRLLGKAVELQKDSPEIPRWAAWADIGEGTAMLALSTLRDGGKSVSLKLGKLSWK